MLYDTHVGHYAAQWFSFTLNVIVEARTEVGFLTWMKHAYTIAWICVPTEQERYQLQAVLVTPQNASAWCGMCVGDMPWWVEGGVGI